MHRLKMTKKSWRKRSMSATDISGELPIYNPASAAGRRESQSWSTRSVVKYKRIHLIPIVVMLCFFILWIFSTPVELETKDGITNFVPITKKPQKENGESTDVDLTVLALDNSPYSFLSLSNGPYASIALRNQPYVSFLDSHDDNSPLTDSHEPKPSSSLSYDLKPPLSVSHEPNPSFSDSHEPNNLSDSHDPNTSSSLPQEAISYPGITNEDAP